MNHGLLISFEGIDQSGKQTQTERLAKALEEAGQSVVLLSFHDYSTVTGQKIKDMLYGRIPFDPIIFQCLATVNKYEKHRRIVDALMANKVVIMDRWVDSAMAYGMADGVDPVWLEDTQLALVQPDMTIYMQIPVEESFRRKGEDRDFYEGDKEKLELVKEIYDRVAQTPSWVTIDGTRDKDTIAEEVFAVVRKRMEESL